MENDRRRALPTVADVAERAGVSPGTVSKALNGTGQLREATRQRVIEAAEAVGFQANRLARDLIEGRTYTVGVLTSDSFGRFTIPVMLGLEDTLVTGRISTLLCDGRGDAVRERHYLTELLARRVDGIVVTGRRRDARPSLGRLRVPVIYVLAESTDPADASVTYDDRQGAELAVAHLLRTGRTKIAHITGPDRHAATQLRAAGAAAALADANLTLAGGGPMAGEWSEAWGREAVYLLERGKVPYDAVFCGSDQIARGVADALRELGRAIPEDVAIVGFDNWDVMAEACRPPLTTIDPNLTELGRLAGERLLDAINGGADDRGLVLNPCDLVIRQSTSAAG